MWYTSILTKAGAVLWKTGRRRQKDIWRKSPTWAQKVGRTILREIELVKKVG